MSDKLALPSMSKANMEAAGIEIKMSRAEMAEYVSNRIKTALKAEIRALEKEIETAGPYVEPINFGELPERYLPLIAAMRAAFPLDEHLVRSAGGANRTRKGERTFSFYAIPTDYKEFGMLSATLALDLKDDELPANYRIWLARHEKLQKLHDKLAEMDKKSFRLAMLEQTLGASVSGQKIIANVAELTAAVIGETEAK